MVEPGLFNVIFLFLIIGPYDAARSFDPKQDSQSIPQSRGTTAEITDSKKGRSEGKFML